MVKVTVLTSCDVAENTQNNVFSVPIITVQMIICEIFIYTRNMQEKTLKQVMFASRGVNQKYAEEATKISCKCSVFVNY
jgi:hypothetical protein